jgi:hypothetical protein
MKLLEAQELQASTVFTTKALNTSCILLPSSSNIISSFNRISRRHSVQSRIHNGSRNTILLACPRILASVSQNCWLELNRILDRLVAPARWLLEHGIDDPQNRVHDLSTSQLHSFLTYLFYPDHQLSSIVTLNASKFLGQSSLTHGSSKEQKGKREKNSLTKAKQKHFQKEGEVG